MTYSAQYSKGNILSETQRPTITPNDNGPLRILGAITVVDAEGKTVLEGEEVYLCRCGNSKNKPFCDGSHKAAGFQSTVRAK